MDHRFCLIALGVFLPLICPVWALEVKCSIEGEAPSRAVVTLTNDSNKAVRLFEDWNGWGYNLLGFRAELPNGESILLSRQARQLWRRNFPSTVRLAPGESYRIEAEGFIERNWGDLEKLRGKGELMIRAVYNHSKLPALPVDDLTREYLQKEYGLGAHHELWHGSAESKPFRMRF